jgi:regulator of cell morphogenesis and NO signaling
MDTSLNFDHMSVGDVALQHPAASTVFNNHQIDFCCGGKLSFKKACENAGVDPDTVMHELYQAEANQMPGTIRFDTWDTSLLCDFIVQHHHEYVRRSIPQLIGLLEKVLAAHGDQQPYLLSLQETFDELSEELLQHMEKEEVVLFPGIQRLFSESRIPVEVTPIPANLQAPMRVMEDEHMHAGDLIKKIRTLTANYTPPVSACPTYRVTFRRLKEFDQDLMQHIHIENNVLFAKVRERLNASYSSN